MVHARSISPTILLQEPPSLSRQEIRTCTPSWFCEKIRTHPDFFIYPDTAPHQMPRQYHHPNQSISRIN